AFWFKGTSLRSGVRVQTSSGSIRAGYNNSGNWPVPGNFLSFDGAEINPSVFTGTNVQDNQWRPIALTWKRGTVNGFRSYVDGVLVNQRNSANTAVPAFTSNFFIGSYNGVGSFTNGALDDIYIYSRSLSPEEIGYLHTGSMG